VIAANEMPDHTTIARFRQRHETALARLFGDVLGLCAQAGLASVEVVAVDGTKVYASASRDATRDYEQIAKEILEQADKVDREEDALFGERRGDELPAELSTEQGRRGWLRDARRRLDAQRAAEARPIPRARPARLVESRRRIEEELAVEHAANRHYEAYRARGVDKTGRRLHNSLTKPYTPPATPAGKVNVTDPDSQLVHGMRGWIQGYNAQAAVNERQIVLGAEVTTTSADFGLLEPILLAAQSELQRVGVSETPGTVLADAGYWNQEQMTAIVARGSQVLIPPDSSKRKDTRRAWNGGIYAFMRRVLETDAGKALYSKRQGMIEPVFAHTKFNRRMDRFQRRGRSAAHSEWRLITATHNLQKLYSHHQARSTA
jgi:hypothetical protein